MIKKCKEREKGSDAGKSIEIALTSNVSVGEGIIKTIKKSIATPFKKHYFRKHPILRSAMPYFRSF
jgi:hypothetical protein